MKLEPSAPEGGTLSLCPEVERLTPRICRNGASLILLLSGALGMKEVKEASEPFELRQDTRGIQQVEHREIR